MKTNLLRIGGRIINLDAIASVGRESSGNLAIRFGSNGVVENFVGQEAVGLWEALLHLAKSVDQESAPPTSLLEDEEPAERVEWFRDEAHV